MENYCIIKGSFTYPKVTSVGKTYINIDEVVSATIVHYEEANEDLVLITLTNGFIFSVDMDHHKDAESVVDLLKKTD